MLDLKEFEKKKKYSEASGSMAVVDSNIQMKLNTYGLYEEIIADGVTSISPKATFVSPNLNTQVNESMIAQQLYGKQPDISFDERLGYYHSLYVGHVKEGDFRERASSGGMGTWIFNELFENNLIDYVIHVKKNEDIQDEKMFKYEISSTIEDIKAGAKTRYYPVEISEVLAIVKDKPGRYAIIGIPSFIYAIRLLAKADKVINERIKYTVGLVCGHQKSTKFSESIAWQVGIQPGDLLDIDFRHKLPDRPASSYAVKMTGVIDGEIQTIIKPTSELFGQNWGWGVFKPTASDFTDDVFNETADIVVGDAWLPQYTQDSEGNNIVIIRHKEIQKLVGKAISENRLKMDKVDNETIFASQASHYRHTHDELAYRLYVKEQENEWIPKKRVKPNSDISDKRRRIQDLRKMISDQSHIQYQKALQRNDFNYFVTQMTLYTSEYTKIYNRLNRKKQLKKAFQMSPKQLFKKLVQRMTQ